VLFICKVLTEGIVAWRVRAAAQLRSNYQENISTIGKSARKVPYGPMNLQKFAHFYVLFAHYIALLRANFCKFMGPYGTFLADLPIAMCRICSKWE
jgi:hypothetical protein